MFSTCGSWLFLTCSMTDFFFLNLKVQINSTVIKMALNQQQKVTRQNCKIISICWSLTSAVGWFPYPSVGGWTRVCVYEAQCCTWVRMHIAFPSPRSGDCTSFHLDLFQAPVERRVIRDEDQLCTPATNNASQNDKQRTHDAATCQNQQKKGRGSKKLQIPYIILSLLTRKASLSKNCLEQVQSSEPFPRLRASPDTLSLSMAGLPPRIQ